MADTAPFLSISDLFSDKAEPAAFPKHILRFRNQRWADQIGLGHLSDEDWKRYFAAFEALPGNLPRPMAMRYHGHQFHVYNPDLGDGRGFLFAQVRDIENRLLDLGTKGSGQTRWSRQGDGRLTLKGGVREILASTYLEALGVKTSKTFSLIETGEQLARNDEPSPTRSAVMTRLSHSHVRFGSFQRAAYLNETAAMTALIRYCTAQFFPSAASNDPAKAALDLFAHIVDDTARMVGQWMATGFVHGVMNTDNFNITGETFDFGPWRFLEKSDPNFTAAYFDQQGLYRFGRQPTQGLWALQQLGGALSILTEADDLSSALKGYEPTFQESFAEHTLLLLGLERGASKADDLDFLQSLFAWMTTSDANWPRFFFDWFGGTESQSRANESPQADLYKASEFAPVKYGLLSRSPLRPERLAHPYFQGEAPVTLLIEDVENLWAPIHEADDWSLYHAKLQHIEAAREAYDIGFERLNPGA